jgi:uncharacterized membrane protein YvlD (DUF360 family)
MDLFSVVFVLVVVGVVLWLVNQFVPMADNVKKILNAFVVIVLILWLVSLFLGSGVLPRIRVGR